MLEISPETDTKGAESAQDDEFCIIYLFFLFIRMFHD